MAWTRTLAQLVDDVKLRADVKGYSARHTDAHIERYVQESYQSLREWMTASGSEQWLVRETISPLASYIFTSAFYGVDFITTLSHVAAVELKVDGKWERLKQVGYSDALRYQRVGRAEVYYLRASDRSVLSTFCILPNPFPDASILEDGEYDSYPSVLGMKTSTFLDTQSMDLAGFDWIVLDAVLKIITRDADMSRVQLVMAEREAAKAKILDSLRTERIAPRARGLADPRDIYTSREIDW